MANIGVKIPVWLLLGPLLGGCLLGGFRMIRPPGAEVLGPIAIHCFSLWLLGLRPSGLITSKAGQIALMVVLDLMGFMFVFIPSEHVAAAVGFSMLGAYTFFAGTDFFARSGFVKLADTFINSKSIFEASERSHGTHYTYTTLIVLTAIAGVYVQLRWGDKEFSFDKPRKKLTVLKVFWHGLKALIFCGMDNISCCGVEDLTCENFCGICCYCIPMPIRRCCCCGIGVPHDDGDVAEK
ncbi:hypothetical protein B0O80DRAFT_438038 [Mortierella sp. GBAus27b]|nr:hypothetical protein B0O80DRAFT_438038 [Mortierella sp. GBAus27b]